MRKKMFQTSVAKFSVLFSFAIMPDPIYVYHGATHSREYLIEMFTLYFTIVVDHLCFPWYAKKHAHKNNSYTLRLHVET